MTDDDRFWAKVDRRGPEECWPWLRAIADGYGRIRWNGKSERAHRVSFLLEHGHIPSAVADHACQHRRCVNPAHLVDIDRGENVRRGNGSRTFGPRTTQCSKGHPWTPATERRRPDGTRYCAQCNRDRAAARRAR